MNRRKWTFRGRRRRRRELIAEARSEGPVSREEALKAAELAAKLDDQEDLGKLVIERYDPGWKARLAYWWSIKQYRPSAKALIIANLLFWLVIASVLEFYE